MISKTDVLNAALKIVDIEGLENLSLAQVASALGIRTPSLYNHVEGLPGLKRDLAVVGFRELARELSNAAIGRERDSAVRELSRAYRHFAQTRPGLYSATFQRLGDSEQAAAGDVLSVAVAALNGYGLDEEGTLHAVRGLRSALHGFVTLEAGGQFAMPLAIDKSFDLLIETIIAGLRTATDNSKRQT